MVQAIMSSVTKVLVSLSKHRAEEGDGAASASHNQYAPSNVSVFLAVAVVFLAAAVCLAVVMH